MTDEQPLPPGLALSWGVVPTNRRGPKPGYTVAEIVATAIGLADLRGAAELSMPHVAAQVGLTTSALYRYVRSRDELIVLMVDAAWGAPPVKVGRARGWRTGATAWTRGLIDRLGVHPWLLDLPIRGAPVTPNLLRWLESFLRAMSGSGLRRDECLACALLLDGYARSTASVARDMAAATDATASAGVVRDFLAPRLGGGEFPLVAELFAGGDYGGESDRGPDVGFALTRILDGIEKLVGDRRDPAAGDRHAQTAGSAKSR